VPVRVSPTDRIHRHIDDLFAQDRPLPEILEEVARLGAQLLMQAALEAEVTEFLGRDRYARAALTEDARPGSRNGYRDVTVKTTAGPVTLARRDQLGDPQHRSAQPGAGTQRRAHHLPGPSRRRAAAVLHGPLSPARPSGPAKAGSGHRHPAQVSHSGHVNEHPGHPARRGTDGIPAGPGLVHVTAVWSAFSSHSSRRRVTMAASGGFRGAGRRRALLWVGLAEACFASRPGWPSMWMRADWLGEGRGHRDRVGGQNAPPGA